MTENTASRHVETIVRSAFEEGRCGAFYVIDIEISAAKHIGVFIDGDEGVSLDACKQISRTLEALLDEEPSLGGIYQLEVSSPGVNRPLRFLRQYPKHIGRTLLIELAAGGKVEGKLMNTDPGSITLEIPAKDKKSKAETLEVPFADITKATVTIQFGRKA